VTPRSSAARRRDPSASAAPPPSSIGYARPAEARPVDLASMRLVLRQHLDELRARGVDDSVLRPLEVELSRWENTVEELVARLSH